MFPDILSKEQKELLPLIRHFKREFYLVGGTAIALQVGHRRSIDFDLFKLSNLNATRTLKKLNDSKISYTVTRRVSEQINIVINSVKMTFFQYPYEIEANINFENTIRMPDLLSLSAIKAYDMERKWKDYVDLYFLLRDYYSLDQIIQKADSLFGQMFSGKLFRAQIAYHKDINYSEPVEYMPGFEVDEQEIKDFLIDKSLNIL